MSHPNKQWVLLFFFASQHRCVFYCCPRRWLTENSAWLFPFPVNFLVCGWMCSAASLSYFTIRQQHCVTQLRTCSGACRREKADWVDWFIWVRSEMPPPSCLWIPHAYTLGYQISIKADLFIKSKNWVTELFLFLIFICFRFKTRGSSPNFLRIASWHVRLTFASRRGMVHRQGHAVPALPSHLLAAREL